MRPHSFDSLIANRRRPSVFAGAGLSWGVVPGPSKLLRDHKDTAEAHLGVSAEVDLNSGTALYAWADKILAQLDGGGSPPKLRLAQALGIIDDDVWAASVTYPANGLSARHRVLARFAREDLWQGIWTWNWDCLLESALEAIGFKRGAAQRDQPWLTRFNSVVTQEDFAQLGDRDLLCILKPHGCAARLADAVHHLRDGEHAQATEIAERFMVGQNELTSMRDNPTDSLFFTRMRAELSSHPSLVIGWSVSEPYLQAVVDEALSLVIPKGRIEELSIVDIAFNNAGHTKVAECYGLASDQVFFKVDTEAPGFTTDAFFLWLQALLTVARMADAAPDDALRQRIVATAGAIPESLVCQWADTFVPAWTRLCWRANLVACAGFQSHQLAIDRAEEHIPLTLPGVVRPDLAAAGRLFCRLDAMMDLDFATFPGAIWDQASLRLVLPLPYWDDLNELEALKPMTSEQRFSYVQQLDILPLHFDAAAAPVSDEVLQQLRQRVSNVMSHPTFSDATMIGIAEEFMEPVQ